MDPSNAEINESKLNALSKEDLIRHLKFANKEIAKLKDALEVTESMVKLELDGAKSKLKSAKDKRSADYAYGLTIGIGTALCCLRKVAAVDAELLKCEEIIFTAAGRCYY